MKHLLIISLIVISLNITAQYKHSDTYIAAGILATTFAVIEFQGQNMTKMQCQSVAITGFVTSIGFHYGMKALRKRHLRKKYLTF